MVPLMDSLEDKEFPKLSQEVQRTIFFEFGSVEEHYKYRDAVKKAYPYRKVDENSQRTLMKGRKEE